MRDGSRKDDDDKVSIIKLDKAGKTYENKRILSDINLEINVNDRILIKGKSGSGKTTLSKLICGLEIGDTGKILAENGEALVKYSLLNGIFLISHSLKLIESLSLFENSLIPLEFTGNDDEESVNKLEEYYESFGIMLSRDSVPEKTGAYESVCGILSSYLTLKPKLLILDDVTKFMSKNEEDKFFNKLRELYSGALVLISDSIQNEAEYTKIYTLNKGVLKNEK